MTKKKLIEKLGDLATFLTLATTDMNKKAKEEHAKDRFADGYVNEGMANAYETAFKKVDGIIKEAKG